MNDIIEERNDNHVEENSISLKTKLAYGVGHVLNDVCASMWFTYLLVYFNLVLGFHPTSAGLILLIGQVADALSTPFVGFQSDKDDNFWLCKYGRRKTWHLIGTICVLGTFPFIFSQCIGCETSDEWAKIIYYAGFVIIFQFGWASVQISHLSLIPDLTPFDNERTALTAIRYTFTVLSNVLVFCITLLVLHMTSGNPHEKIGPSDAHKFQEIVLIGMSVGLVSTIIFHVFTKETTLRSYSSASGERLPRELRPPCSLFKDLELYQVASIYMATRLFVNLTQIYIPLYLSDTLKMPKTALAVIPLVMYLSSLKASLSIEYFNAKFGRKLSYLIGTVMGLSACIFIWFGKGKDFVNLYIYPTSLLIGSGGSMMLVTSLSITADYIGNGTENGAFIYGIMSFTDKLSNGLAVMLIQYMRRTVDSNDYYKIILTFVCGGAAVIGAVMTLCKGLCKNNAATRNYSNMDSDQIEGDQSDSNA